MMDERRQALTKVLVKVAANIEKLQQRRSRIGEQDTKTILINPILGALGWDLQSIDDVSQEYRHKPKDNPVDYALFFLRQPCLFVEAKALGSNLDDRKWISQTISYATIAGVEWCILTNGAEYRLYNAHAPVAVDRDGELVHANEKTYAFSNQWGGENWHKAMGLLKEKYPQFKIDFSAAS
jgi:hypothetical protein